ncbi:hypothetical protein IQ249_15035 [Lusitaniella coriacea LEGE 07157]|uniref:Uncharacterized protein n=1 Tax=Lusitaniella coriacea LEGE 07157 TaxID=945747 RepID=A0A8J7DZB0_9CYAN|nr:hypothetical protein [Lusitaniella coriacea]MBE9117213.1 hypothetical protein [Lusitaniella coriacea LEGE 07157]
MNTVLIKKLTIGGGYGLALICCLLAFPQYKSQTEETIGQTLESVDRALNDPSAPAEIEIATKSARHPLAGLLVRASVWFAVIGTGGVVWSFFGQEEQPSTAVPPFLLAPASNASASALPRVGQAADGRWQMGSNSPPASSQSGLPYSPAQVFPIANCYPSGSGDFEQRRLQLFQYLANSPSAWILQLLEATPVLIWGEQQSGKTELAQIIALLRMLFLFHSVEVSDPHEHLNSWLPCFSVFGSDFDYEAIDARLVAYRKRLKSNPYQKQPITTIWDEFTQYEENCTCQKTKEFDFIKSVTAESQKTDEFPILISHGRTKTAKGGTTGTDEMFENGCIQIHLLAQRSVTGRAIPSGKGFLKGLSKDANGKPEQFSIEIPAWLRAMALYQYFPEIHQSPFPTSPEQHYSTPPYSTAPASSSRYADLAVQLDNLMDSESLSTHLQAILKLAFERSEPIKARDVQRASLNILRNLDAETIRSAFRELEALGKGYCQGEGSNLSFVTSQEESS